MIVQKKLEFNKKILKIEKLKYQLTTSMFYKRKNLHFNYNADHILVNLLRCLKT